MDDTCFNNKQEKKCREMQQTLHLLSVATVLFETLLSCLSVESPYKCDECCCSNVCPTN